MELSKEAFEKRITDKIDANILHSRIVNGIPRHDPPLGKKKIDSALGPMVVALALTGGEKLAADVFNVSPGAINNRVNGRFSKKSDEIAKDVKKSIADKAADLIVRTLNGVETKDLESMSAKELVSLGVGISSIMERTSDKKDNATNVSVKVYCPDSKKLDSYPIIEVNGIDEEKNDNG